MSSVDERYEEWKKNRKKSEESSGSSGASSVDDRYKAWRAQQFDVESTVKSIYDRTNTYLRNYGYYMDNYKNRYSGRTGTYEDAYVSDAGDWLSTVTKQKENFDKEASNILSMLDRYSDYLDPDWAKSVRSALQTAGTHQADVVKIATGDNDFWSKFTPNEEQLAEGYTTEKLYKQWQADAKEEKVYLDFDTVTEEQQIASLQELLNQADQVTSWYTSYQMNPGAWDEETVKKNMAVYKKLEAAGGKDALEKTINERSAYLDKAKQTQERVKLNYVNDPTSEYYDPDFEKYSGYAGSTWIENGWDRFVTKDANFNYRTGYTDIIYDFINDPDAVTDVLVKGTSQDAHLLSGLQYLTHMTEDEVKRYNYLYNKFGKEKADKYLDGISDTLQRKQAGEIVTNVNSIENDFLKTLAYGTIGTSSGMNQWIKGTRQYFTKEEQPTTALEYANAELANSLHGIAKYAYMGTNVIGNMIPSLVIGKGLGALGVGVKAARLAGAATMSIGAAGNAYLDGINTYGMEPWQARIYGNLVGAAEGGLEYAMGGIPGISKADDFLSAKINMIDKSLLRIGAKLGWDNLKEINEEVLQNYLEPLFRSFFTGEYDAPTFEENLETAIVTALSTPFMGAKDTIINDVHEHRGYVQSGQPIMGSDDGVASLQKLANDVVGASAGKDQKDLSNLIKKVQSKPTARSTGMLYDAVQTSIGTQNHADIVKSLTRGENAFSQKKASEIAGALIAQANGLELTQQQSKLLDSVKDNPKVQHALAWIVNNEKSTMGQRNQNLRNFQREIRTGAVANAFGVSKDQLKEMANGNVTTEKKKVSDGSYEVSADGKASVGGNEVKLDGLRQMDDGSIMVATSDNQTADPGEVAYPSKGHALVYENYVNIETTTDNPVIANMDVADRSALAKIYAPASGVDAKEQFLGLNQAYWYGFEGLSMDEKTLPKNSLVRSITTAQRDFAYDLGKKAGEKAVKTQEAGMKAAREAAVEKLGGKEAAAAVVKKNEGKVVLENNIRESTMTKKQRASYQMADIVAKAISNTVHVYHGMQEYGKYDPATGEIWLNINGNFNGSSMMAFALSHELVHMAKQWRPAEFKAFADYLLEQYGKKGVSVESLIRAQMANAKENGYTLDEHEAYEEVIADACARMLLDSEALQKMASYKEKNPSKWQQIVDAIKKFIANIRKVFKGAESDSIEAELFKEFDDAVKNELEKKFVAMVMNAGENLSTIRNAFGKGTVVEVNADGEFTLAKGKVDGAMKFLYNDSTWERGGRDTLAAALKAEGFSKEDIKAALTIMDGKHELVKELAEQFPEQDRINKATITTDLKDGHSVLSALVSNGDYPVNIDLLMVCKKRKAYQRVINRLCETGMIQQATVDALAIAEINKILGKYGFETACLGCFVESRRLRIQEWANTIVKEWNAEVKKRNPDAKAFGFGKGEATLTKDEVMQLVGELEGHEKNDQGNLNLGQGSAVKRMGVLLDKVPSLRKTLSVEDLITPDGLTSLRSYDSNLFSMVKSRYGSNSPKFVQEFNPYNHELAVYGKVPSEYKSLREYLYAIGGARMQSFSDFIVENWFDYCQIVADLAVRKLPMHTYTKEIALAKLFGQTGIKINMSLIPDIDRSLGREFAGLTRNAKGELELIWADKDRFKATGGKSYMQSINFADAIALQNDPKYSGNVGTIAVGVSDKHILMMLDDNRIRMIIPYHSSGMNPIFADLMGTSYYKDYTMFQNTTVKQLYNSKGEPVSLKLEKEQSNKLVSGFQFNAVLQELGDARAAAQAYKDWCADASKHTITIKGETYTAELTPKFDSFSWHDNYYKLLEDFNTYDCISEQAAPQGDVQQTYPEDFDQILKGELKAQEGHRQKQEANQSFDKAMDEIMSYLSTHTKADTVFYAEQHGVKLSDKDKKLGAEDKRKLADLRKGMKMSMPKVDSNGKQLTDEQQEFFKDSVVRDADGKLMVMYHGTANGGAFTVFDGNQLDNSSIKSQIGQGFYFTNMKNEAESYMKNVDIYGRVSKGKNPNLHQVYLNITNPFDVDTNTLDIDKVKSVYMDGTSGHFFDSYISHYLNNKTVNGRVFTKAEVQDMSKADRVSLYVDYLAQIGTKELLSNMVHAFSYGKQSELLASMRNRLGYDGIVEEFKPGQYQYVAFSPEQIKSVDNQNPTSDPDIRYSMPKAHAPTFYSHMARVVDGVKQEKLGAASVVSMLRGKGVKAEEIKWSGIETFLEGKKSVTKAELQEFIAGSMLQIEEEILDNNDRPYTADQQKRLDEYEAKRDEVANRVAAEWKKITGENITIQNAAGLESMVTQAILEANSKQKKATFEGRLLAKLKSDLKEVIENNDDFGFDSWMDAMRSIHRHRRDFIKNYDMSTNDKAIIVKYCNALNAYNELPNMISDADTDRLRAIAREAAPWNRKIMEVKHEYNEESAKHRPNWKEYSLKGGKNYREMLFRIPGSTYSNAAMFVHWKERSGVLAHARIQDMDTFIGKMLFIEEIQSDWHNEGHKEGYRRADEKTDLMLRRESEKAYKEFYTAVEKMLEDNANWEDDNAVYYAHPVVVAEMFEGNESHFEEYGFTEEQRETIRSMVAEEAARQEALKTAPKHDAAPDAPFKDTYHEYVLKRLLRMAAEEGYDSIGWTPAATQMDRWNPNRKTNRQMGITDANDPDAVAFEGAYRNVYDRRMKKFLSDFGDKWGTTVGKTVLDNGTEVWSMAITDSMKDSVLYEGQPKYAMPKKRTFSYNELVARGSITGEIIKSSDYVHMKAGLLDEDWMVKRVTRDCKMIQTASDKPTYYAEVPDIGRNVQITSEGILHGGGNYKKNQKGVLPPAAVTNNKITVNLVNILRTAIEVNHSTRGSNIDIPFTHIMLGVAGLENENGSIDYYGVRIEIEERANRDPILVGVNVLGRLKGANAKKISSPHAQVTDSAGVALATGSFAYNIADLLKDVKKDFDDTFSLDVYRKLKMSRAKNDFSENLIYKAPNYRGMTSRQLLADAFDELVQTPKERELMDQYRRDIANVEDVQERLRKLRAEISKLSKDKGDKAKIAELSQTAKELAELIDKYDRRLLDLEASKPLRDVLARARSAAYQEAKKRGEESLKEYRQQVSERFDRGVESRRKTEMRKKIRKVIRDLDKILNRGDKKRNVKEDMKDFVAEALASAEVLFTDNYSNEDIIRNGFGVELSNEEAKYLEEARGFMDELANLPTGGYDVWQARQEAEETLKNKLAYRMSKLKDAFFRERQRLNKAEVAEVLGNLADAYAKLENSEYAYVNGAYHEAVHEYLKNLQEEVGGAKVRDMTLGQLEELHKAYTMVLTTVQNANKMFADDIKQSKEEIANRVMMEVYNAGGEHGLWSKGQLARNQASWNNTKPIYAAERTGSSTFVKLVKGLFKGQYNWATDMEEAKLFRQKVAEKYGFKSWDMEKTYKFTSSSGIDFELNLNQIMSLYAYAKRDQAHEHLLKGGFVFGKNTEVVVTKNGIKRTYLNKSAKAHNISDEIMGEIVGKLSPEQKGFVDEMQDYLSTTMGEKGNEVSMRLYGVKLFMEKFYFPLRSAGQFKEKAKEAEMKQQQGHISIVNSGFTKATTPKASNPVVLDGFTDVWAGHVNEMSLYHSMVLPMEDFRRVYNYASPNMEGQESASVNSFIENAYGDAATGYFDQLYNELNGGAIVDPRENLSKQMIGKFKKAAVLLSNSVWVQQFSSIGRAYALIDPKYFIGPKVDKKKHAALWAEMKQYAPVAIIKEMGGFDTHTGLSAAEYLLAEEYGKGERVKGFIQDEQYRNELMGHVPAKADELTWCAIWEAVKRETQAKNPDMDVKSEEFLKKAGERFSEIIEKTQVYDSVLARSANMRSKQGLMQMLTAFMAEPTTTVNMIEDAIRKGNKSVIARTLGSVAVSIILNNALASIIYAMRDDDEDETFLEKYAQAFASGMLDDINPMTYYPILKDIWSLFQGYDVERTDMAIYSDIADSVKKIVTLIAKYDSEMDADETAEYYKKVTDALMSLLDSGASAFGIPLKNVRRDLVSYYNTYKTLTSGASTTWSSFVDAVGGAALDTVPVVGWVAGKSATDKLYDAIISGDKAYVERLKGGYKDEDAYSNAVRKALRENDPRVKEAAQAQIDGNPSERVRIARLIIADGFAQDDVVRAINAEINALTSGDNSSSMKKEKGFYTAEDFAMEIANGDHAAANAAKSDFIRTAQKNGKTAEEAEDSFVSSARSELKELFLAGEISEDKVIGALVSYCEMDEDEAELKVESYVWEKQGYDGVTSAAVRDYNTFCASANVPKDVYMYIRSFSNNTENDKDANGKSIAYSAMKKIIAEIDAQPGLTPAQKTAIARSLGWAETSIQKYKTW